jgi:hypothetical protein
VRRAVLLLAAAAVAACGGAAHGPTLALRPACLDHEYWDIAAGACKPRGSGAEEIATGKAALDKFDVDAAKAALDAGAAHGPLARDANITLWEQRGIAAAYNDDAPHAREAFDMLLALDPGHFLSYKISPKATFVFEEVRNQEAHRVPELDVDWPRDDKVGQPVPLAVGVLADPKKLLDHAEVYVRTRGEKSWRAADLPLHAGSDQQVVLPPVIATAPTSLELYLRAYDAHGDEVLQWADAQHPREIALRYEPPQPWYRKWWVITIAAGAVAAATGVIVYEATLAPPDTINGTATATVKP